MNAIKMEKAQMTEPVFDHLSQAQYVELAYGISAAALIALVLFLLLTAVLLKAKLKKLEARREILRQKRAGKAADKGCESV